MGKTIAAIFLWLSAVSLKGQWEIEKNLHWWLDEIFNEDKCRMHMDNSGENFAVHLMMSSFPLSC